MNINEVQNQNAQNNDTKILSIKNYSTQKSDNSDFSRYVEVSKANNVQNQNQNENNENAQNEELIKKLEDGNNIAYVQTFQAMNNELFTLGMSDENQNALFDKDMFSCNLNLSDMNLNDIKLFEGLIQKTDLVVNNFDTQNQTFNMTINGEGLNVSYRSLEVSNSLFMAIDNAAKTGKPVRLDFGPEASVILKIGKDGKLSADFVPNEKAMELAIKNAIPQLKAKFEEENIPYGELNYRNYNQQKNQKDNNKENKDE